MCCKSLQVHEEGLQTERHLFRSCRHKCLNPRLLMLMTHDIQCQIQHFVKVQACQSNLQLAAFTFTPLFGIAADIICCACLFFPLFCMCLRAFCLGQETVTDVRNILYLYNIKKVLEHVKQLKLPSGLHLQRWAASTTSLKV